MILYVCGPMTGLANLNYPAFMTAEETLVKAEYDVLNPARVDEKHLAEAPSCLCKEDGYTHSWEWYMDRCIPMVREADGIAVLTGWADSRGAKREIELALNLGKPLASVPTWVTRRKMLQKGRFE